MQVRPAQKALSKRRVRKPVGVRLVPRARRGGGDADSVVLPSQVKDSALAPGSLVGAERGGVPVIRKDHVTRREPDLRKQEVADARNVAVSGIRVAVAECRRIHGIDLGGMEAFHIYDSARPKRQRPCQPSLRAPRQGGHRARRCRGNWRQAESRPSRTETPSSPDSTGRRQPFGSVPAREVKTALHALRRRVTSKTIPAGCRLAGSTGWQGGLCPGPGRGGREGLRATVPRP